jgi:hypothetical protein
VRRKSQPTIWGGKKPRAVRRSKEELDKIAEEYREWRLRSIHLCMITFGQEDDYYQELWQRGYDIKNMSLVELRKLKGYKAYEKEFYK